jgi:hypothetical protein
MLAIRNQTELKILTSPDRSEVWLNILNKCSHQIQERIEELNIQHDSILAVDDRYYFITDWPFSDTFNSYTDLHYMNLMSIASFKTEREFLESYQRAVPTALGSNELTVQPRYRHISKSAISTTFILLKTNLKIITVNEYLALFEGL